MSLRDLEQIQHDVVEPRSRALLAEVVKCYEGGAHRAALVSLWIAVVADLTSKVRYLAESGDGEAAKVIEDLDRARENQVVRKVQEYERNILDTAEQRLGVLLARERLELERLNEDRNLCAHPGYVDEVELFVPDAEAVRAHLVAAHRAVFSQRPLAGKRLLVTLEVEMKGESWPSDGEYFLDRFFRHARETVQANMAKLLIKHSLAPPEGSDTVAQRARSSMKVIAGESPAVFESGLRSVLHRWEEAGSLVDSALVRALGAYGSSSTFGSALPGTGKSRLVALLRRCDVDMLIEERFFVSGVPSDELLAASFVEIVSGLSAEQARKAIGQSESRRPFVRSTIFHVKNSPNFRGAETSLRLVELCSAHLEHQDVVHLRQAIQENPHDQVRLAGGTEAILSSIYSASSPTADTREEWRALARWLHERGVEKNDEFYLYDDLKTLVEADQ